MGSPLYAALLERSADDLDAAGPVADLVADWQGHAFLDNLPIRWVGALHFLALSGRAPELAAQLPSTGGRFEEDAAWSIVREFAATRSAELRPLLDDCIQTNEVHRCCALYPGALHFARRAGRRLHLLEIGSSAGLNLCMDRYRYQLGDVAIGPADASLELRAEWRGRPPPVGTLSVAGRRGCDVTPVDLSDPVRRLRLLSFVWPDQHDRRERLERALAAVGDDPPQVDQARAGSWLEEQLAAPRPDLATLVFHSVMWMYVPAEERSRIREVVEEAGERAEATAPLGWLRMEPPSTEYCEVRLRSWPGGEDELLGRAHFHGSWVEWLEPGAG